MDRYPRIAAPNGGGDAVVLVDVRQPEEFTAPPGHLPGALNVPLADVASRVNELGASGQPIVLVCKTRPALGARSCGPACRGPAGCHCSARWHGRLASAGVVTGVEPASPGSCYTKRLYDDPRVAGESSCRRRACPERRPGSASTSFPAVISKDVDGGPPPAMTITTNRKVNDFAAWYYIHGIRDAHPAGRYVHVTIRVRVFGFVGVASCAPLRQPIARHGATTIEP